MTTQFTVKLGTEGLNAEGVLAKGLAHVAALTDNLTFPTPVPTLVQQQADCDALALANIAVANNGGKQDRLAQRAAMRKVKDNIKILAGYVQAQSGGDPLKIASAAFGTRKVPQPPVPMAAPPNLRLVITTKPGELKARWGAVKDKRIYELQICDGDPLVPENWRPLVMTSRNYYLLVGLVSHRPYSLRVLAVGSLGLGPWSDVATTKPL